MPPGAQRDARWSLRYHVLKCDWTWPHPIHDPYRWALEQIADGPIEGPDVGAWARNVLAHPLERARADMDGDGVDELFIRQRPWGRVWAALVFRRAGDDWRYVGYIEATLLRLLGPDKSGRPNLFVYKGYGGGRGTVAKLANDGSGFVHISGQEITNWGIEGVPPPVREAFGDVPESPLPVTLDWQAVPAWPNCNAPTPDGGKP